MKNQQTTSPLKNRPLDVMQIKQVGFSFTTI